MVQRQWVIHCICWSQPSCEHGNATSKYESVSNRRSIGESELISIEKNIKHIRIGNILISKNYLECLITAALGKPVVPEVYMYNILSEKLIESTISFAIGFVDACFNTKSRSMVTEFCKSLPSCTWSWRIPEQKNLNDSAPDLSFSKTSLTSESD